MKQMGQTSDIRGLWVKMVWVFFVVFLLLFSKLKIISETETVNKFLL